MDRHFSAEGVLSTMKRSSAVARSKNKKNGKVSSLIRALLSEEEGGPLVEMAVVLPLMMLLITGMCSFGLTLNSYLVLTNAVQTGAMDLALNAGSTTDPCNTAAAAVAAAAPTLTASKIIYTFNFNGTSAGPFTGTTASSCTSDAADLKVNTMFTVTAQYQASLFVYGLAPRSLYLTASTAELAQ
jgi:Flp pilus assembly protein TadG